MLFKRINAWFHLWVGLASGIIVFILSITGCILVFEHEIKSVVYPWIKVVPPSQDAELLPPSRLREEVIRTVPDKEVVSIWYHGLHKTAHVSLEDSDSLVYINPYTAKIEAIVTDEDFFHFMLDGHVWLWLPQEIGHAVTGWATFLFFILLISGLILWWPKKWNKTTRAASFGIKWKAKFKRLNYDLHNVLGFYSLILAAVFAFTALLMSFSWMARGVYWAASGGEERPPYARSLSDTTAFSHLAGVENVDRAWKKGINELAGYNKYDIIIGFPHEVSQSIYVCTDMVGGTWRDMFLDQHTLEVLPGSQKALGDLKFADLLFRANYGLHVGEVGGLTTKIIYFIASLICASLPVTGFFVWWNKRKKKPKRSNALAK